MTCTTETNDIADPVRDGGFDNLDFGLAEYAEGEAPRTFIAYKLHKMSQKWIPQHKSTEHFESLYVHASN